MLQHGRIKFGRKKKALKNIHSKCRLVFTGLLINRCKNPHSGSFLATLMLPRVQLPCFGGLNSFEVLLSNSFNTSLLHLSLWWLCLRNGEEQRRGAGRVG